MDHSTNNGEAQVSKCRQRHPRFYFKDGNVIFLVEDVLFKVHRYFFERDSPVFSTMFSLPPPKGESPEGETDASPIVLEGFKSTDFERFLSILYPLNFQDCGLSSVDEWTSALAIASIWEFESLRRLAIDKLSKIISPVDRIVLGKRFKISYWLIPAFVELCTRPEPLNLQEGERLGVTDVIRIGQVRHQIRYVTNSHEDTIVTLVGEMFSNSR